MRSSNAGSLGHNRAAYMDPDVPVFLHIPRTGGHSRAHALHGAVRMGRVAVASHNVRASDTSGLTLLFVRHPVARFLSVVQKRNSTPEHMVEFLRTARVEAGGDELLLRRQSWWNDRDGVELYRTEGMEEVWPDLMTRLWLPDDLLNPLPRVGEPEANSAAKPKHVLTDEQRDIVLDYYDEDMALWIKADPWP